MLKRLKAPLLFASAFLAILLGVYSAEAAWNLRQNGDGSTDFVKSGQSPSDGEVKRPVGRVTLSMRLTNIHQAATHYIASPVTGTIKDFTVTLDNALTQAVTLTLFLDSSTAGNFVALAPTMRLLSAQTTGYTAVVTGVSTSHTVKQYRPIAIRVDDGATAGVNGFITINIDQ